MRQIGINLNAKQGMTEQAYLDKVKELGFDAVFTGVPGSAERMAEIGNALEKRGLVWETMHAPYKNINQMWLEGEGSEQMLASLLGGVDACHAAGVPILVVHLSSGNNPPPISEVGFVRYTRLLEYAAAKGVKIAFENQRKPDYLAWAFERFGRMPHVGFCFDCGHEGCFTPNVQFLPLYGDRLLCTHIHDNNCMKDQDLHVLPFDGRMDFGRIAAQLRATQYKGPLTLEIHATNSNKYDFMTVQAFLEKAAMSIKRFRSMVDF